MLVINPLVYASAMAGSSKNLPLAAVEQGIIRLLSFVISFIVFPAVHLEARLRFAYHPGVSSGE